MYNDLQVTSNLKIKKYTLDELRELLKKYYNEFFEELKRFLKQYEIDDFTIEICCLMLLDFLLNGYDLFYITYEDMNIWIEEHSVMNGRYFDRRALEILSIHMRNMFMDFYIEYDVGTKLANTKKISQTTTPSTNNYTVKDVARYRIARGEIVIVYWDGNSDRKKISPLDYILLIAILLKGKSYFGRSNTAVSDGGNYLDYFNFYFYGYIGENCNELFKYRVLDNKNIMFDYYKWLSKYINYDFNINNSNKVSNKTKKNDNKSIVFTIIDNLMKRNLLTKGSTLLNYLQDLQYSKTTFDIPYPFLIDATKVLPQDYRRYYADGFKIDGVYYRVCNHWVNGTDRLQDWYNNI